MECEVRDLFHHLGSTLFKPFSAGTTCQAASGSAWAQMQWQGPAPPNPQSSLGHFGGLPFYSLPHQVMKSCEGGPPREGLGVYKTNNQKSCCTQQGINLENHFP